MKARPAPPHPSRLVGRALGWLLLALPLMLGASEQVQLATDAGQVAWESNDLAGALVHWSQGLKAARADGDEDAQLDLALRLSAAHRGVGNIETAGDLLEMAAELTTDEPVTEARVLQQRGHLAMVVGDSRLAEKSFQAAFRMHRDAGDPPGAADAAVNLGLARSTRGDLPGANKALTAAASLFETLGDRRGRADALNNLGVVQRQSGDLLTARTSLEQALELFRAAGDVAGEADALTNLGRVLQDLGREGLATELYVTALSAARQRKDVARQAALLSNLGTLAHESGELRVATEHYQAAEQAFADLGAFRQAAGVALNRASISKEPIAAYTSVLERAVSAKEGRIEAIAALNLASLLREDKPDLARDHLDVARSRARRLELREVGWRVAYLDGLLALDRGKDKVALQHLREAVDSLEHTRRGLERVDAQRFMLDYEDVYETLIDALLDQGDTAGAFLYSQRLQRAQLPGPGAQDETTQRFHAMAMEEERLVAALSGELVDGSGEDNERTAALRQQLDELRVDFARTVDELRATHDDFDSLVRVEPEDLEALQQDLEPGVVVLQPLLFEDKLVLLVFRRDRLTSYTVDTTRHDVTRTAAHMARMLRANTPMSLDLVDSLAERLGGWLVAPLAEELSDAEVLVVSATGPFRQIPFGMLRNDGRYLVQDVAVVGVTHVGSLRKRAATETRFRVSGEDLLLVGNPDGSLEQAEVEVQLVAERFEGARVLIREQGTREAVFAATPGKTTVHLATHGYLNPARPTQSYFSLSGGDEDGRLSYSEIPGLAPHLRDTRLVVLSACESGLPVEALADETSNEIAISIDGLASQFRRAGVETLVASLWRVDDKGTRELMNGFYGELQRGADIGRAMRGAQLTMLADEEFAHPWYWAAFVVMGDWR